MTTVAESSDAEFVVHIKLVDIDDYFPVDQHLPAWWVQAIGNDSRYPPLLKAEVGFHHHFHDQIRRQLLFKRPSGVEQKFPDASDM